MDLAYFKHINLYHALCRFFADLNIPVNYLTETPAAPQAILTDTYNPNNPAHQLMREVYVVGGIDDAIFNRRTAALDPQQLKARDYEGLLIFGVTLQRSGDLPTRSQMAEITRAFNREFHYTPVIIVFSYDHYLSFASCERLPYKQTWREGEKTGKVSILKDVDPAHPHTGHLKILETLKIERSGKQAITSFEALYQYWQRVFSVALLNKRFYQELANWYFWAMDQVSFPDDVEKNPAIRNATSLIRLITRVIFIWFIKEKQLVPDILFDRREMRRILKTFADTPDAHSYYNAILQNLFFGTLNQKMNERRFAEDTQHYVKADHGVKNLLRYQEFFSISAPEVLALFANIPFLNGGLFDCLDKDAADTGKHVFVDGFTRNAAKRAIVPDLLFFRDETIWDLNALYGTKNKTYTVKGLFDILAAYKFTIAENTPIEEEIALDPELLGKVFENLLASYNPETQTTARKQTGSFYTPREIVNYMVDESLIAYLSNALQNSPPGRGEGWVASEVEARLRHLLAYTDAPHQFTDAEVAALMTALHTAKILDPACGSGAFPMGMLHKMVHILTKLDPANVRWRETQR
ncbi:MAG: hypothetical protein RBT80_16790, partial [Candidatus Vecturithrix sp.]|nr:hypothetical protein [Candidatus Vecturithrix sp.]